MLVRILDRSDSIFLPAAQMIRDGHLDEGIAALAHAAHLLTSSTHSALRARIFSLLATVDEQLQAHGNRCNFLI